MTSMRVAIGLMSGTSLDGIDAALIKTDGLSVQLTEHFISVPYKDEFREKIKGALGDVVGDLSDLEHDLTVAHYNVVKMLLESTSLKPGDIDVIGFHGQTIFHDPDRGSSLQIGDGKLLAELSGINVVNDFRSQDIRNGGQGAPLVPIFHSALLGGQKHPLAVVNIGGVANITYLNGQEITAFDTGPGNALIDDWIKHHTGKAYDEGGEVAASGKVDEVLLSRLLDHQYFAKKPPKSLDRDIFSTQHLAPLEIGDGASTLTEFTVRTIALAKNFLTAPPKTWIIMGGGRKNKHIIRRLNEELGARVIVSEEWGIDGDAVEAQAFAYLAVRSMDNLPLTFPSTTGVKSAATGGVFCQA